MRLIGCEHGQELPHAVHKGGDTVSIPHSIEVCNGTREASPAELLAAARPHADLEAAAKRYAAKKGMAWDRIINQDEMLRQAGDIVLAALGADDE